MKEINPKLAKELLWRIEKLEAWCDARAKDHAAFREYWKQASVMAFDIRQHLLWHIQQNLNIYTIPESGLPRHGKYRLRIGEDSENTD